MLFLLTTTLGTAGSAKWAGDRNQSDFPWIRWFRKRSRYGGASATTEMLYRLPQRGINDFLQELRSEDAAMVRDVFTNDLEYGSVNSFCAMPDTIPELPKLEQLLRWIRS